MSTRGQRHPEAHVRACASPLLHTSLQEVVKRTRNAALKEAEVRGGDRCEEETRMLTYAFRVAVRGRPLRSGANTAVVRVHTTPVAAAVLEA